MFQHLGLNGRLGVRPRPVAVVAAMGSPVVDYWMRNPILVNRGAAGCLTLIPRDTLSRFDVLNNPECIIPILKYMGTRPSVDALAREVQGFFSMCRPRGKPEIKSILPNSILFLSRVAFEPHHDVHMCTCTNVLELRRCCAHAGVDSEARLFSNTWYFPAYTLIYRSLGPLALSMRGILYV